MRRDNNAYKQYIIKRDVLLMTIIFTELNRKNYRFGRMFVC